MARIPYPQTPDVSLGRLPAPLNAFRMMSHARTLTGPTIELGLAILGTATLPPRLREMVIMHIARLCDCPYEQAQHAPIALDAGVTPAQLAAIAEGDTDLRLFAAPELAVLAAAAELLTGHTWPARTVDALRAHYTDRQIVELAITVGYYAMLAGLMNGLDVDVDPAGERFTDLANRTHHGGGDGSSERGIATEVAGRVSVAAVGAADQGEGVLPARRQKHDPRDHR